MERKRGPKDDWQIDPSKTAVLVVDMQRAFLDTEAPGQSPRGREIVPRTNELTAIGRKLKMPVIFIRQANCPDLSDYGLRKDFKPPEDNEFQAIEGRIGADFYPELNVTKEDYIVTKNRYSAFITGSSSLERLLRAWGRDSLIICGIFTEVCVATTAIDAMMLDFKVFLISDLTTARSEERQQVVLEMMDERFAKLMTFDQVKAELNSLLAKAGV